MGRRKETISSNAFCDSSICNPFLFLIFFVFFGLFGSHSAIADVVLSANETVTLVDGEQVIINGKLDNTAPNVMLIGQNGNLLGCRVTISQVADETSVIADQCHGFGTTNSIVASKRVNRKEAFIGDIITYTVSLRNVDEDRFPLNDLELVDYLPKGFRLVTGSLRQTDGISSQPLTSSSSSVDGIRVAIDGLEHNAETTIRYQTIVGASVNYGTYTNRAFVETRGNVDDSRRSNDATVSVRVVPDPLFDFSTVMGKVFNDENNNGRQDKGEKGIPHAQIITSGGALIRTDQYGRYHLPNMEAGRIVLRLQEKSLPQGSKILGHPMQIVDIRKGMPSFTNFAVQLSDQTVIAQSLLNVEVKRSHKTLPRLHVSVEQQPIWDQSKQQFQQPVSFHLFSNYTAWIQDWEIQVRDRDYKAIVWSLFGNTDQMDAAVLWNGTPWNGGVLDLGGAYEYRLEVTDATGRIDFTDWEPLNIQDASDSETVRRNQREYWEWLYQESAKNSLKHQNIRPRGSLVQLSHPDAEAYRIVVQLENGGQKAWLERVYQSEWTAEDLLKNTNAIHQQAPAVKILLPNRPVRFEAIGGKADSRSGFDVAGEAGINAHATNQRNAQDFAVERINPLRETLDGLDQGVQDLGHSIQEGVDELLDVLVPFARVEMSEEKEQIEQADSIQIIKTSSRQKAKVGEIVTYTIHLENQGGKSLRNLELVDDLPDGFMLVPGSMRKVNDVSSQVLMPSYDDVTGQMRIQLREALWEGDKATIHYQAIVGRGVNSGIYTNRVFVEGVDEERHSKAATAVVEVVSRSEKKAISTPQATATEESPVVTEQQQEQLRGSDVEKQDIVVPSVRVAIPEKKEQVERIDLVDPVQIIKTSSRQKAKIGEIVTYTIHLENQGGKSLRNLELVDDLPDGFVLVPGSMRRVDDTSNSQVLIPSYNDVTGQMRIQLGRALWRGDKVTVHYQAMVGRGVNSGIYTNEVFVQGKDEKRYSKAAKALVEVVSQAEETEASALHATAITKPPIGLGQRQELLGSSDVEKQDVVAPSAHVEALIKALKEKEQVEQADSVDPIQIIKMSSRQKAKTGEIVTYTIHLENQGDKSLRNLELVDDLPDGFILVPGSMRRVDDMSNSQMLIPSYNDMTGQMRIELGRALWRGDKVTVHYQAMVGRGVNSGVYTNEVFVQGKDEKRHSKAARASVEVVAQIEKKDANALNPARETPDTFQKGLGEILKFLVSPADASFEDDFSADDGSRVIAVREVDLSVGNDDDSGMEDVPLLSDYTLVSMADAEIGYSSISGNLEEYRSGEDGRYQEKIWKKGHGQLYFHGTIKGKYLVTTSFDSERETDDFFRTLDPEKSYPVYGDGSSITDLSGESDGMLYLLVEWDASTAKWGRFDTNLNRTDLMQFNRKLQGGTVSYQDTERTARGESKKEFTAFHSNARQKAARNELEINDAFLKQFSLRHTNIESDSVQLKIEYRNKYGNVYWTETLSSDQYELYADAGEIDLSFYEIAEKQKPDDKIWLIANYEYRVIDDLKEGVLGSQGRYALNDHISIGATHVEEDRLDSTYKLGGVDITTYLSDRHKITAEYAESESGAMERHVSKNHGMNWGIQENEIDSDRSGHAVSLKGEFTSKSERSEVDYYYRKIEAGFSSVETGDVQGEEAYGASFGHQLDPETRFLIQHNVFKRAGDAEETEGLQSEIRRGNKNSKNTFLQVKRKVNDKLTITTDMTHQDVDDPDGSSNLDDEDRVALMIQADYAQNTRTSWTASQEFSIAGDKENSHKTKVSVTRKYGTNLELSGEIGTGSDGSSSKVDVSSRIFKSVRLKTGMEVSANEESGYVGSEYTPPDGKSQYYAGLKQALERDRNDGGHTDLVLRGTKELFDGFKISNASRRTMAGEGSVYRNLLNVWYTDQESGNTARAAVSQYDKKSSEDEGRKGIGFSWGGDYFERLAYDFDFDKGEVNRVDGQIYPVRSASITVGYSASQDKNQFPLKSRLYLAGERHGGDIHVVDAKRYVSRWETKGSIDAMTTLYNKLQYDHTEDHRDGSKEARADRLDIGFAYRPIEHNQLNLIGKYSWVFNQKPDEKLDLFGIQKDRGHVFAVEAIYELGHLPWTIFGKAAYRYGSEIHDEHGSWIKSTRWLTALGGEYEWRRDHWLGLELRRLNVWNGLDGDDKRDGAAAYYKLRLNENAEVAAGYSWSEFDTDLGNLGYVAKGPWLRVTGALDSLDFDQFGRSNSP